MLAVVTSPLDDGGPGTLRVAIENAMPGEEITFDLPVGTDLITLTSGYLQITDDVTITGPGSDNLTISANDASQIFFLNLGSNTNKTEEVTIQGLTLKDGNAFSSDGGAIAIHADNSDVIRLERLSIHSNEADEGGAIWSELSNNSTLIVRDTTVSENRATGFHGGGIKTEMRGNVLGGTPELLIERSQILTNEVLGLGFSSTPSGDNGSGGGGVAVVEFTATSASGNFVVRDSVITGNESGGDGGGIFWRLGGDTQYLTPDQIGRMEITRSKISENKSVGSGGGVSATAIPNGLPSGFETIRIADSTISGNTAYGLIDDYGYDLKVKYGGGGLSIYATSTVLIENSTISGNRAMNGGGIQINSPPSGTEHRTDIRHSTIARNAAGPFDPMDPLRDDYEYQYPYIAVVPPVGDVTVPHVTGGGGIAINGGNWGGRDVYLDHTILADNIHFMDEPVPNANDNYTPDISARPMNWRLDPGILEESTIIANYAIIEILGAHVGEILDVNGMLVELDPAHPEEVRLLEDLADNGDWPTLPDGSALQTHAPIPEVDEETNPIIDGGDPTYEHLEAVLRTNPDSEVIFDERGVPYYRVYEWVAAKPGHIDIGAFELQPLKPAPTDDSPKVTNVIFSSTVTNPYGTNPPYAFDAVVGSEEQLRTIPVGSANRIALQFSEDVTIGQNDLEFIALNRVVTNPTITDFDAPDIANGYTATWMLSSPLLGAQYLLRVKDSVVDLDSTALDGEWTNPGSITSSVTTSVFPSGNGIAGGNFEFVFMILPGDADRDLIANGFDYNVMVQNWDHDNKSWGQGDFNGDGSVNGADYNLLVTNWNRNFQSLSILGDYDGNFVLDGDDQSEFEDYYDDEPDNLNADLTGDGQVNSVDYDAFYDLIGFDIALDVEL